PVWYAWWYGTLLYFGNFISYTDNNTVQVICITSMVWYGICFELYEELKNSINLRARMKCVTILDDDMDIMGQLLGS
ncbi:12118_t:CDS:1, partial [Rhizophagus irregularis]